MRQSEPQYTHFLETIKDRQLNTRTLSTPNKEISDFLKKEEYDVSSQRRMIQFFSYFRITEPHLSESFGSLPPGYARVILPFDKLASFRDQSGVTAIAYTEDGILAYGMFQLTPDRYSQLPRRNELRVDLQLEIPEPKSHLLETMVAGPLDNTILPDTKVMLHDLQVMELNPSRFKLTGPFLAGFNYIPQLDSEKLGLTKDQEVMLARVGVSYPEFKTFNQHVSVILSQEESKNFVVGDFLIPKTYGFKLDGAKRAIDEWRKRTKSKDI